VRALLTPEEVAGIVKANRRTVERWARRGEIPCIVLKRDRNGKARMIRFSEDALARWLKERES
jgi:excisionase family DNA binding protein